MTLTSKIHSGKSCPGIALQHRWIEPSRSTLYGGKVLGVHIPGLTTLAFIPVRVRWQHFYGLFTGRSYTTLPPTIVVNT